jgi:hypothetical protein
MTMCRIRSVGGKQNGGRREKRRSVVRLAERIWMTRSLQLHPRGVEAMGMKETVQMRTMGITRSSRSRRRRRKRRRRPSTKLLRLPLGTFLYYAYYLNH